MGQCLSSENRWKCSTCNHTNSHETKVCVMCSAPRKWICGNCNRLNPGAKKVCIFCLNEPIKSSTNAKDEPSKQSVSTKNESDHTKQAKPHLEINRNPEKVGSEKVDKENAIPESGKNSKPESQVTNVNKERQSREANMNEDGIKQDTTEEKRPKTLDVNQERRIAVIGRYSTVATRFCNWIIGMNVFQRDAGNCQQAQVKLFRKKMKIAKTPDTSSVSNPAAIMNKCIDMLAPGPHVFLMLVNVDNFTEDDKNYFDQLITWFGDNIFNFLILVLFSKKTQELSQEDIQKCLDQQDELKKYANQCQNRIMGGAIFAPGQGKITYLERLTEMIETVISDNYGRNFSPEVPEPEENDWDLVLDSYREIAGVVNPGDVQIFVKEEESDVKADPEKQLDRFKRGLDKLSGISNTPM